mgnify:FL=1
MTRFFAALAALFVFVLLVGCGNKPPSEDKPECSNEVGLWYYLVRGIELTDIERVCSHLATPDDFLICSTAPNVPGIDHFHKLSCPELDVEIKRIDELVSLGEYASIRQRCRIEPKCLDWAAHTTPTISTTPILELRTVGLPR